MKDIQIPESRKMQGLWIPVGVYKLRLSWAKKILCIDINSMTSYYKSNAMIGEFLGCSARQAQRLVTELIKDNWIESRSEMTGQKTEIRYLKVSEKFNQVYHEDPTTEMSTPHDKNGTHPTTEMSTPHDKNGHPVLPVSLTSEIEQVEPGSPSLSLESEPDTKTNVAKVKAEFLSLSGKGGRWGTKQTKVAQGLLKDFPPEHICENLRILREEAMAKGGQYGWSFSMEKLNWKWEELETIKKADEMETARLRRMAGV